VAGGQSILADLRWLITTGGAPLPSFKGNEDRQAKLRMELDVYYARLYGLNRKQLRYLLD
jgi:hypothetical protein